MNVAAAAKALLALNCFPFQKPPVPGGAIFFTISGQMMAAAKEQEAREKLEALCDKAGKALLDSLSEKEKQ